MAIPLRIAVFAVLPALASAQDAVHLKNGKILQGKVLTDEVKGIRLEMQDGSTRQLLQQEVRRVLRAGQDPGVYGVTAPKLEGEAAQPPKTYIRYRAGDRKQGQKGSLSTGISRWHHKPSDTTIWQVGVVHIAEQPYYERIQRLLDRSDLVLFEGVGKGQAKKAQLESMSALGKLQVLMNNALGLRFQKNGIEYKRSFFRRADVDFDELRAELDKNGAALPTDSPVVRFLVQMVTKLVGEVKNQGDSRSALAMRAQLAPVLAQADKILATRMKAMGNAVINFRNKRVIEILAKELQGTKGRHIAIFYGAGHMPDLDKRLLALGCRYQGADWLAAWHFPGKLKRR